MAQKVKVQCWGPVCIWKSGVVVVVVVVITNRSGLLLELLTELTNNVWATNWFFKLKIHNPLCFRNILFASDIFSLLQRYILIASAIYPLRLKHLSTFHLNFRISLCHSSEIRLHPRKSDLATFLWTYKSHLSVNAINENFCLHQFLHYSRSSNNGNNISSIHKDLFICVGREN